MADQLRTTEGDLYEQAFPPKDLAYYLGELLRAPVRDIPTEEDYRRTQGEVGLPTEAQTSRQVGQAPIDYVTTFLGPLLALMTSQQYARTKAGNPAPTWKEQSPWTKANSPLEQLRAWRQTPPWSTTRQADDVAPYRTVPQIGGPTGKGMTPQEAKVAFETDYMRALIKQIRDTEARGE